MNKASVQQRLNTIRKLKDKLREDIEKEKIELKKAVQKGKVS
ncbi:hypothetical protein [Mesobacillus campisalis]|nr:hypothetical protein [Mesobacillus campisalis]